MHIAGRGQVSVVGSCEGDHDFGFHTCPEFFDWHHFCQLQDNCTYFMDLNSSIPFNSRWNSSYL